ncbi:unnamed protein product [Amoebophrya sp. A25]|nr:unnamed protein product [Amoebophrya sp. A25]|eukprot:GSA25T00018580001.1
MAFAPSAAPPSSSTMGVSAPSVAPTAAEIDQQTIFLINVLSKKCTSEGAVKEWTAKMKNRIKVDPNGFSAGSYKRIDIRAVNQAEFRVLEKFRLAKQAQSQQPGVGLNRVGFQPSSSTKGGSSAGGLASRGPFGAGASSSLQQQQAGGSSSSSRGVNASTSSGNNNLFADFMMKQTQKPAVAPWQDQYEDNTSSRISITTTSDDGKPKKRKMGGPGGAGSKTKGTANGGTGGRAPRAGKEQQKWDQVLMQVERHENMYKSVNAPPLVAVESLPTRASYRTDPWPPGFQFLELTAAERRFLWEKYHEFGREIEEIETEMQELNDRIGSFSRQCAGRDELESFKKSLEKDRAKLTNNWGQVITNSGIGRAATVKSDDGERVVTPMQLLGCRVWQALVQIGERRYLGPPRVFIEEARNDYPVLKEMIDADESKYKTYLEERRQHYDPDQYEILLANSAELNSVTAAARQRVKPGGGNPNPSPTASDDASDDEPLLGKATAMKASTGGAKVSSLMGKRGAAKNIVGKAKAAGTKKMGMKMMKKGGKK